MVDGAIQHAAKDKSPVQADGQPLAGFDLISDSVYKDFELSWEWKISVAGNSGLKYNVDEKALDVDVASARGQGVGVPDERRLPERRQQARDAPLRRALRHAAGEREEARQSRRHSGIDRSWSFGETTASTGSTARRSSSSTTAPRSSTRRSPRASMRSIPPGSQRAGPEASFSRTTTTSYRSGTSRFEY